MKITKVRLTKGAILIRAEEQSGEEDIRRIELESRAEPRPEFHEAMGGLIGPALNMIEAPVHWWTVAIFSGLSLTYEEGRGIGAVVTVLVPLECAPSPLVINTPYLISHLTGAAVARRCLTTCARPSSASSMRPSAIWPASEPRATCSWNSGRGWKRRPECRREELEPAHIVAGELVVGSEHLAEVMNEQSAAEPQSLSDRPPHEVRAEFERIRAEAMRKEPVIKPARGRRPAKVES